MRATLSNNRSSRNPGAGERSSRSGEQPLGDRRGDRPVGDHQANPAIVRCPPVEVGPTIPLGSVAVRG